MKAIKRIWWKYVMLEARQNYNNELLYRLARYKLYLNLEIYEIRIKTP